jgi:hypothetical protein
MTIIKARRILLAAAHAWRDPDVLPIGARDAGVYRVRGCAMVVSDKIDWVEGCALRSWSRLRRNNPLSAELRAFHHILIFTV